MSPDKINDQIARACGVSPGRCTSLDIRVRPGQWPTVTALIVPDDAGELLRVLATLEPIEDLAHIEVPIPTAPTTP